MCSSWKWKTISWHRKELTSGTSHSVCHGEFGTPLRRMWQGAATSLQLQTCRNRLRSSWPLLNCPFYLPSSKVGRMAKACTSAVWSHAGSKMSNIQPCILQSRQGKGKVWDINWIIIINSEGAFDSFSALTLSIGKGELCVGNLFPFPPERPLSSNQQTPISNGEELVITIFGFYTFPIRHWAEVTY